MTLPVQQPLPRPDEWQHTPISCCVMLRSKSMYYRPDERPGKIHQSEVMTYWCQKTHDPEGPDHQAACAKDCQSHRRCYESTE